VIERAIGVVLDTSAVRRFQAGEDAAVGELIGEVGHNYALVAVPVTVIAAARASTEDATQVGMLDLLVSNRNVKVFRFESDEGLPVGATATVLDGDLPLAQAIHLAEQHEAQLATEQGELVRVVAGDLFGIVDI
jgi:predicted nucleic acid-binding protein